MKKRQISFLCLLLICARVQAAFDFPAWMKCTSAAQCEVVNGLCGEWDFANRKFSAAREKENQEKIPSTECADPKEKSAKPGVDCVANVCFPKFAAKLNEDAECRVLSHYLGFIFSVAGTCKEDADCAHTYVEPIYQCRTGYNRKFESKQRLSLLNRYYEQCGSTHKSGFAEEDKCQKPGWTVKCKNAQCTPALEN